MYQETSTTTTTIIIKSYPTRQDQLQESTGTKTKFSVNSCRDQVIKISLIIKILLTSLPSAASFTYHANGICGDNKCISPS